MKLYKLATFICYLAIVSACSSTDYLAQGIDQQIIDKPETVISEPTQYMGIHFHSTQLAHKLFSSVQSMQHNAQIAVGTFTDIETLKETNRFETTNYKLGLQLAESLTTISVQYGLTVVEFKTLPGIQITESSDLMLSRNISLLDKNHDVDYFLTGTLTVQDGGTVVNAKLIDVNSNFIVAAATHFIHSGSLFAERKVNSDNNALIRSRY
jgi:TolB-like protein